MWVVCVADDCVDETALLCEGLKLHGYGAVPAYTGQEALERCRAGGVDLLLLDIGLPDLDGYEVCRQLKADPETRDIPVIFVTARGAAEDVAAGFSLGAVDYITKPYNLPIIMVRVNGAMRTHQGSEMHYGFLQDVAYTDPLTGLRNRSYLRERLQEEIEKSNRHCYPISCLFLDICGTETDEEAPPAPAEDLLVDIALVLRQASRQYDVLARFDGALFVALLPHASQEAALKYAQKIREEISALNDTERVFSGEAQLCVGIVTCQDGKASDPDQVLSEAMRTMLHAATQSQEKTLARHLGA